MPREPATACGFHHVKRLRSPGKPDRFVASIRKREQGGYVCLASQFPTATEAAVAVDAFCRALSDSTPRHGFNHPTDSAAVKSLAAELQVTQNLNTAQATREAVARVDRVRFSTTAKVKARVLELAANAKRDEMAGADPQGLDPPTRKRRRMAFPDSESTTDDDKEVETARAGGCDSSEEGDVAKRTASSTHGSTGRSSAGGAGPGSASLLRGEAVNPFRSAAAAQGGTVTDGAAATPAADDADTPANVPSSSMAAAPSGPLPLAVTLQRAGFRVDRPKALAATTPYKPLRLAGATARPRPAISARPASAGEAAHVQVPSSVPGNTSHPSLLVAPATIQSPFATPPHNRLRPFKQVFDRAGCAKRRTPMSSSSGGSSGGGRAAAFPGRGNQRIDVSSMNEENLIGRIERRMFRVAGLQEWPPAALDAPWAQRLVAQYPDVVPLCPELVAHLHLPRRVLRALWVMQCFWTRAQLSRAQVVARRKAVKAAARAGQGTPPAVRGVQPAARAFVIIQDAAGLRLTRVHALEVAGATDGVPNWRGLHDPVPEAVVVLEGGARMPLDDGSLLDAELGALDHAVVEGLVSAAAASGAVPPGVLGQEAAAALWQACHVSALADVEEALQVKDTEFRAAVHSGWLEPLENKDAAELGVLQRLCQRLEDAGSTVETARFAAAVKTLARRAAAWAAGAQGRGQGSSSTLMTAQLPAPAGAPTDPRRRPSLSQPHPQTASDPLGEGTVLAADAAVPAIKPDPETSAAFPASPAAAPAVTAPPSLRAPGAVHVKASHDVAVAAGEPPVASTTSPAGAPPGWQSNHASTASAAPASATWPQETAAVAAKPAVACADHVAAPAEAAVEPSGAATAAVPHQPTPPAPDAQKMGSLAQAHAPEVTADSDGHAARPSQGPTPKPTPTELCTAEEPPAATPPAPAPRQAPSLNPLQPPAAPPQPSLAASSARLSSCALQATTQQAAPASAAYNTSTTGDQAVVQTSTLAAATPKAEPGVFEAHPAASTAMPAEPLSGPTWAALALPAAPLPPGPQEPAVTVTPPLHKPSPKAAADSVVGPSVPAPQPAAHKSTEASTRAVSVSDPSQVHAPLHAPVTVAQPAAALVEPLGMAARALHSGASSAHQAAHQPTHQPYAMAPTPPALMPALAPAFPAHAFMYVPGGLAAQFAPPMALAAPPRAPDRDLPAILRTALGCMNMNAVHGAGSLSSAVIDGLTQAVETVLHHMRNAGMVPGLLNAATQFTCALNGLARIEAVLPAEVAAVRAMQGWAETPAWSRDLASFEALSRAARAVLARDRTAGGERPADGGSGGGAAAVDGGPTEAARGGGGQAGSAGVHQEECHPGCEWSEEEEEEAAYEEEQPRRRRRRAPPPPHAFLSGIHDAKGNRIGHKKVRRMVNRGVCLNCFQYGHKRQHCGARPKRFRDFGIFSSRQ